MKNYWINRIEQEEQKQRSATCSRANLDLDFRLEDLTRSYFKSISAGSSSCKRAGDDLAVALYSLADKVIEYRRPIWRWLNDSNVDDFRQELVFACFEKSRNFDSFNDRAFNYFSTVMLSMLRQWHRCFQNRNR